jgi:hypothetical protein
MAPWIGEEEKQAVRNYLDSGGWLTEFRETRGFEHAIAEYVGSRHASVVTNGTVSLFVALAALDIGRGDEVIVPAFSMIASANAVLLAGATPVFVDVDAQLRELQRQVAFDAGLDDRVDHGQVLARRRFGFLEVGDALAEQIQRQLQAARFERARCLDRFLHGFAGDEPPAEALRSAHAVPGRERFQGSTCGEQLEKGFRRAIEHQCVRPGVASRCSIVRA